MRLLMVEDEAELAALLARRIGAHGHAVDRVETIAEAEEAVRQTPYDGVFLDRRLPDGDGLSAVSTLRRLRPSTALIVISALGGLDERVAGLDGGADDYLTKPFATDELLARLRAVLRRGPGPPTPPPPLQCGALSFDADRRVLTVRGEPAPLHRRELALLEALLLRAGSVVPRKSIIDRIYGFDDEVQENTLDALVFRLRGRLSPLRAGAAIHTVRGLGYMIRAESGGGP